MRTFLAIAASALLVAGIAAWKLMPAQGVAPPISAATAAQSSVPRHAQSARLTLSAAQTREALSAGTLDRPIKSLLKVDKPLHFGEFAWNDSGVSAGPVWIRIDPRSQLLSVFRDGHEIGTTVIVYGGDNKETPTGTFHIIARDKDHRSSLYDAAMPYTLQLTNDGVSIHGSTVRWGAATHGCIGVPLEFARRLFDQAKVGDEVVILPYSAKMQTS